MFPFDGILFDIGGVLLTNGWDVRERAVVLDHFGLDRATFEFRHVAPNDAWERDAISLRQYLDATVFYEPRTFTHEEFFDFFLTQSRLLPDGAIAILEELASGGNYLLGVLNNEAREPNDYRLSHFGLRNFLDVTLSSCYLGLRKPDPAIYRRALDILGKPAERILFIDDRAENVAAAQAAGIVGLRFEGADSLRTKLAALGVL